jgi:hypothetical protein
MPGQTEREAIAHVRSVVIPRAFPDVQEIYEAEASNIPADHICDVTCEFARAFEWRGGVKVNMAHAREIHMGRIRQARNAELVELDVLFMRAVEAGDTAGQASISTRKQFLRDIPQVLDLATVTTPRQLKATWPGDLERGEV